MIEVWDDDSNWQDGWWPDQLCKTIQLGVQRPNGWYGDTQSIYLYLVSIGIARMGTQSADEVVNASPAPELINFPNPFTSTATIRYVLPEISQVSLRIYNESGKLVKTLVNGFRMAGPYTMTFDGRDLSSGIYFVRFNTEELSKSQKMVLMK
jgi:hypothetical protein